MQAQTAQTRPTASQIIAAQRAAKKSKRIERNSKIISQIQNGTLKVDKNKAAATASRADKYIRSLCQSPAMSENDYLDCNIKLWLEFNEMRRVRTAQATYFMQYLIRQYRILAVLIYRSPSQQHLLQTHIKICNEAYQALEAWFDQFHELSPNQRDTVLQPLQTLCRAASRTMPEVPVELAQYCAKYSLAVGVLNKGLRFIEHPSNILCAFDETARGSNAYHTARKYHLKYSDYQAQMLDCANLIYEIHQSSSQPDPGFQRPQTIAQCRHPVIQRMVENNADRLVQIIHDAQYWLERMEAATQKSTFDWAGYTARLAKSQAIAKAEQSKQAV
ncbi:hypothetical protein [Bergeriella denitrificans]|uniref:Putative phage associated protein n=1 Tax=Bergeriella denitrificans TaxID=494 RepID=A0A378ULM8_BERDE|nr:hypothetical protein [Bergeriella denitrificans]STZ77382.1 putative phage associated protein [Bergeriella denitrificans]